MLSYVRALVLLLLCASLNQMEEMFSCLYAKNVYMDIAVVVAQILRYSFGWCCFGSTVKGGILSAWLKLYSPSYY